ncbi:MAG: hypothetical protein AABZ47_18820 [Planctomycetota bacterium]
MMKRPIGFGLSLVFVGALIAVVSEFGIHRASAVEQLTPFEATQWTADGSIVEFINFGGDDQEYFNVNFGAGLNFGAIKVGATLTRGVVVARDNSPLAGNIAGPTGHFDRPGGDVNGNPIPTGFNIGRVFLSYNPEAFGGDGGYFMAMDISAPALLDTQSLTAPRAFDVDGDGSNLTVSEINPGCVSEAPTSVSSPDGYGFEIDTDGDGSSDVAILIAERRGATQLNIPGDAVSINPGGAVSININGTNVQRFVIFTDATGTLPGTPQQQALLFLDSNEDGILNHLDFGIGEDVELAVRNVGLLPPLPGPNDPACVSVTFTADTFDDECLGGGAEDLVTLDVRFPVPDIEVIKEVRCADEAGSVFSDRVSAVPGSRVEFRITIQNWGNEDLNVSINDVLTRVAPATASLVPGSCLVSTAPAGFNSVAFCAAYENALNNPGGFPLNNAVTLLAGDDCATGLGDQLIFTFRMVTGPAAGSPALCDNAADIINAVSVTGTSTTVFDPILAPVPPSVDSPDGNAEEEDTNGDNVGDVADEFTVSATDQANVIDTGREILAGADDNVAEVELECRDITFSKRVRLLPGGPFQTGATPVNLPTDPTAYPIQVEYQYTIQNNGESAENFILNDAELCADIAAVAGISLVACPICQPPTVGILDGTINAATSFVSSCTIQISTVVAANALAARDDGQPACRAACESNPEPCFCYQNCASVSVTLAGAPGSICDDGATFNSSSTVCIPRECDLEVTKDVVCLNGCGPAAQPIGTAGNSLMAVPGACLRFLIDVDNVGGIGIPLVCLDDALSCNWTIVDIAADISGDDVSGDLGAFAPDGTRRCFTFPTHLGGIGIGETLHISIDVQVPANFPVLGLATDCRNTIEVDGYESTTDNPNEEPAATCTDVDDATVDVKVPRLECAKTLSVDLNNDGSIDVAPTTAANITNPAFPLRIIYNLTARNTGELPINGAQVCDTQLVADAIAAGLTVGPCALCTGPCDGVGDSCASLGVLAAGASASRTCEIVANSAGQWEAFAGRDNFDGRSDCYTNNMRASGTIEPPCAPPNFPTLIQSVGCSAIVCIPITPECPITKAKFDIWNMNEIRFSGTERCITSWDQTLLSDYTDGGIANHFRRASLQTDKGRARIDGLESSVVCGAESIAAPLLGVAAKILRYGQGAIEKAGMTLVGSGTQAGSIRYDLPGGPVGPAVASGSEGGVAAVPDPTARANVSIKGSFLVYTKVEIKWNDGFQLIQDTILDITNDYSDDVRVQLYFVNGDQPVGPVFAGDPPFEIERAHLGCNAADNVIVLTGNEPTYWAASTGLPKGVSPFTVLDPGFPPGRPDTDPNNAGGRILRGYVLAWAVNDNSEEIRWNHLKGDAIVINYAQTSAWEYNTWNFVALAGVREGDLLLPPLGLLGLDGNEYANAPDQLIFDFYASGTVLRSVANGASVLIDTDLTLWAAVKDLRQP